MPVFNVRKLKLKIRVWEPGYTQMDERWHVYNQCVLACAHTQLGIGTTNDLSHSGLATGLGIWT